MKAGEYVRVVALVNGSFMSYVAKDGEPTAYVDGNVEIPNLITPDMDAFYTRYPHVLKQRCDDGRLKFRYTHIRIRYGYTKRTLQRDVESVRIGIGNTEWGAP